MDRYARTWFYELSRSSFSLTRRRASTSTPLPPRARPLSGSAGRRRARGQQDGPHGAGASYHPCVPALFSHFRTHSGAFAIKYSVMPVPTGLSKGLVRTEVAVINIPPRHFVHMQLTGSFDTTEVVVALTGGSWKRVELVGKLHRGLLLSRSKSYRKTIATP